MSSSKVKVIFVLIAIGIMVMCFQSLAVATPQKTYGEVQMVQPQGWPFGMSAGNDAVYAEHVNEPNSRANLNNAQADAYREQQISALNRSAISAYAGFLGGAICIVAPIVLVMFLIFAVGGRKNNNEGVG